MTRTLAILLLAISVHTAEACTQYPATYTPRSDVRKEAVTTYLQNRLAERPFATIALGDSIMRLFPYELVDAMWGGPVLNTAIGGSTVLDINWRLDRWPYSVQKPAVVFVAIGTNDVFRGYCPNVVASNIVKLLVRLKTMYPNARIIWQNILGRGWNGEEFAADIARINAIVLARAQGRYEVFDAATPLKEACQGQAPCTLYSDTIHPYYGGYEVIYRNGKLLP
jgi:lysophospholipase L1-like esterase